MAFVKSYNDNGHWIDISLTDSEEADAIEQAEREHRDIMGQCINEAKGMGIKNKLEGASDITKIAIALFDKRARHTQFIREDFARTNFEKHHKAKPNNDKPKFVDHTLQRRKS